MKLYEVNYAGDKHTPQVDVLAPIDGGTSLYVRAFNGKPVIVQLADYDTTPEAAIDREMRRLWCEVGELREKADDLLDEASSIEADIDKVRTLRTLHALHAPEDQA